MRHACKCRRLPEHKQQLARTQTQKLAPSVKLKEAEKKYGPFAPVQPPTDPNGHPPSESPEANSEPIEPPAKKAKTGMVSNLFETAKGRARVVKHRALDLAIIKLICAAGLPMSIVGRLEWLEFLMIADSTYHPASREKLEYEQIVGEAEEVCHKQVEALRKEENLTISFDGSTTRGKHSIWTIHVSTEDRRVYFVEACEATKDHHTATWIHDLVFKTMNEIGPSRFSSVVSDSTSNTRGARQKLVKTFPTLVPLADICHHISNTIKDIVRVKFFQDVIAVVRKTIAKFHKSHIGISELEAARKLLGIKRGLEKIGKTRFATIIHSAKSVQRNLPALKKVAEWNNFNFGDLAEYFETHLSETTAQFEIRLTQLIAVGNTAAKALTILESNEASADDVYLLWHGLVAIIIEAMKKHKFPESVQDEILRILNH
ncbi:hypothetical protein BDN72DRAFT_966451, partial [Pluteus cervinus]